MVRVGVAGSAYGIKKEDRKIARKLGETLGSYLRGHSNHWIYFCFDKKSLPLEVAKEARKYTNNIVCFVINEEEAKLCKDFFTVITGLPRMVREYIFINSIDLLLVLGGGSGTLMEVTFAYQMGKPIYLIENVQSSVDAFREKFIDRRERVLIKSIKVNEVTKILRKEVE